MFAKFRLWLKKIVGFFSPQRVEKSCPNKSVENKKTFEEVAYSALVNRGLFPDDAKNIIASAAQMYSEIPWDAYYDDYPAAMHLAFTMAIEDETATYIEDNFSPHHWVRDLFPGVDRVSRTE